MRGLSLIAAGARRLDHALGRAAGRAQVLIDVRTPMNLAVLRPVWLRLAADDRVTVTFTAEDMVGVGLALERDGLATALIDPAAARWRRFDLALTADAWNQVPLLRCDRRIKFFHGVAGKYDLDDPRKMAAAGLDRFDRLAFINSDRLERYVSAGIVPRDRATLVGFPKVDELVNGTWKPHDVRRSLGLDPELETVLYAPTFSTANSLHLAGEALIHALLASGRNVMVKLHDRSMVPSEKHTAGIDWPARLARFAETSRFALVKDWDATPYLSAADVLVTDHSTVGFEFALLDRPVVVYDAPQLQSAARIDAGKWELLRSMADVVTSPGAAVTAVDRAFEEPQRLSQARQQARALFAYPGHATDRALAVVYDLLNLPQYAHEILRRHRHA